MFSKDFTYRVEALLLKVTLAILRLPGLDAASAMGGWLGRTFGPKLGITRRARRRIARAMPDFCFGRIDVRFASLLGLREGRQFSIIEINGVGPEATHIWDPSAPLGRIWLDQMHHYGAAWSIAAALRRGGARSSGLRRMYVDWRRQKRLMASYPLND